MNAKTAIELAVYGGVIPAVSAVVLYFAMGWLRPKSVAARYRMSAAFAVSTYIGYVCLPSTKSLVPSQYWQWVPCLGVIAAFIVGLTRAEGVTRGERWLAICVLVLISACMIAPEEPALAPTWPVEVAALAAGALVLTAFVTPLPARLPGRALPLWLLLTSAVISLLVLSELSETFGRLAALPAGALAGCSIALVLARDLPDLRGLALPYATLVGGFAYVAATYPTTPLWPLLAAPASPLALWTCALGPLSRLSGIWAIIAQAACVCTPLLIVVVRILAQSSGGTDEW